MSPLVVGLAVALIGMSYGANAGYAINPARDFGPRVFRFFARLGKSGLAWYLQRLFSDYWWIPVGGPG